LPHLLDDVQAVCDHVVSDRRRPPGAGWPTTQLLGGRGRCGSTSAARSDGLIGALAGHGLAATVLDDASLEIAGNGRSGDEVLDTVRDVVAQLVPAAARLSTRHASLDEVFLRTAVSDGRSEWPERPRADSDGERSEQMPERPSGSMSAPSR
jgi:hypothetical protein